MNNSYISSSFRYNKFTMTTGQRIRETRLKRNKTMVDLAHAIDVSPTTISKYEANMIHNIPHDRLHKIADYLEVSFYYLIGMEDDENKAPLILTVDEQLLIEDYRSLSPQDQETIRILCQRLLSVANEPKELFQLSL